MNDDILLKLIDHAMADAAFREHARKDLDGALAGAGYRLAPDELAAVREFHAATLGLSDAELTAELSGGSVRRQFPGN